MAEPIDRALRRKLIAQAAERLWRRQRMRAWHKGGAAAALRRSHERPAAPRREPAPAESGAAVARPS